MPAKDASHRPNLPDAKMAESSASTWQSILRMLGLGWRFRYGALRVMAVQLLLLAMALAGLGLTGLGIDVIRHSLDPQNTQAPAWPWGLAPPTHWSPMAQVALISGAVFLIAAVRFCFDRMAIIWKSYLVQAMVIHLRSRVYDKLQRLSFRFFDANESGSIINRVTSDVQSVRTFVDGVLIEVVMMALSLCFFLAYMLSIHAWLTLWCLLTTPLLWVIAVIFSKIVRPAYRENRRLFDKAVLTLSENIQGVHVVRGFSLQEQESAKFAKANDEVSAHKNWIFRRISTFIPVMNFLPHINMLVLLLYGGYLVINDSQFHLGTGLVVFAGLLQQFSSQVGNISQVANGMQRSLIGAQRVFEILDTPLEITNPPDPLPLAKTRGAVRFEQVGFAYQDSTMVLDDISFEVEPGQQVAVLGATGSGKSTLLSLIPRFYDASQGSVMVDDVDVRRYDLDALRRNIGIVFQESYLFSYTVAQNIAFGHPEASRQQIEHAAQVAAAHDFIMELPKGYDTKLTEGGGNLSGGQRQRLAIARAILLEPPILLLDDPTAAIDPETEQEILAAMHSAMEGRTTFVVAHRLSTLRRADLVLVFERGRIVEAGTHEELFNSHGYYRRVAKLQLADAESRQLLGMGQSQTTGGPSL